jgi:hypothetical protein
MELLKWCRLQWDRVCAVIAFAAGAVLLVLGWVGVSGVVYPAEQIPYVISAGFGGLFLLGIGGTLWHSADLRDQWRTLDRIEHHLEDALSHEAHPMTMFDRPKLHSEARR